MIMKPSQHVGNPAPVKAAGSKADQFSPSAAEISVVAYGFWTARDRPMGSPEEDWFRAECKIKHNRTPGCAI
jgi:hypothetical protein